MVSQTELDLQVRNDELETRIAKLERQLGSLWNAGLDRLAESGYLQFDGIGMRWDDKGMQVATSSVDAIGIRFVESLMGNPTTEVPVAVIASRVDKDNLSADLRIESTSAAGSLAAAQVEVADTDSTVDLQASTPSSTYFAQVQVAALASDGYAAVTIAPWIKYSSHNSPGQITSQQDDYNPTDMISSGVLRLSSDASRDITGIVPGGAAARDGRILLVFNVGSFDIVLKDESASSTAANRFALNGDLTLQPDNSVILWYDSTSSRWRAAGVVG